MPARELMPLQDGRQRGVQAGASSTPSEVAAPITCGHYLLRARSDLLRSTVNRGASGHSLSNWGLR